MKKLSEREEREQAIIAGADYFTVVRHLGPRKGYERHEAKTLGEAETLANRLVQQVGRAYLIYAVKGVSDTFVKGIEPVKVQQKGMKNAATGKRERRNTPLLPGPKNR